MESAAKGKQGQKSKTLLKAIKGYKDSKEKITLLARNAWTITHAFVFGHLQFTTAEKKKAIHEIEQYIMEAENEENGLRIFLERIILFTQYKKTTGYNGHLLPSVWLSAAAPDGFAQTGAPMKQILDMRKSIPAYRIEIKALAEALIEIAALPSKQNFVYWKDYFTQAKQERSLEMFCIASAHLLFNPY